MKFYTLTLNLTHQGVIKIEEVEVRETPQFYMTVDGSNTLPFMHNRVSKAKLKSLNRSYTNTANTFFAQYSVGSYDVKLFLERIAKDLRIKRDQLDMQVFENNRKIKRIEELTILENSKLLEEQNED